MSNPSPEVDEQMMRRAIRLAMNGRGLVEPNPMVGCVIVKGDRVIGEGFHAQYGGPHAEPAALAACTESPAGATAYVTLEPCCHTSKKTPPCAPRLIEAKLRRVVVGCLDPNPDVNGKGIGMLHDAGIEVVGPVLEAASKQLIAPFLTALSHRRPFVTSKWAQSANAKIAGTVGRALRITNEVSDRVVHALRARCDAIIVGTNTVLADDPLLTARGVDSTRPLLRVVLSNSLKIPLTSRLVTTARDHPLVIYSSVASAAGSSRLVEGLQSAGAEVVLLDDHDGRFSFSDVLADLHARRVTHALVEPGPTLTRYLFARGQADRVWVFQSPHPIDEAAALSAPKVMYPETARADIAGDTLIEYLNPQSEVFFSPEPSADFLLAADADA
ncbi:MAG TPA: bifunctional diaminohydroxyphosphoribosylaminopyrimidine deaminase/5-amino-6-(5-phosphoribosylamino)uracil reductase RibD [Tepidisphaeraceae bacterium]|nr:bifunctional diaminohydroxyphosphoribosylaminopyrimidine deaminase/5-amino-6-(5-phosphoribosylamino)uracil reductase RibD [Tepidisphaeraceae bacterium]